MEEPTRTRAAEIEPSTSLEEACQRCLDELGGWIKDCVDQYRGVPPTDVHDQATYTTSWGPWVSRGDDGVVWEFLTALRDEIARHFTESDQWRHGYWRLHDVHHGTEHFELFLGSLYQLGPKDRTTAHQIIDAVEHIGNWSSDVPDWFNWNTGLFRSKFVGTDGVREGSDFNVPDHLRLVNLCLLAHEISGAPRYAELATASGTRWAEAILADRVLPVALGFDGPLYALSDQETADYRTVGENMTTLGSEVDRAENFLASNGVLTFLRLWALTGECMFRDAAEHLIDRLVTQLGDPDAGAVAQVVRIYRQTTGDDRYDGLVVQELKSLAPWSFSTLTIDLPQTSKRPRPSGIGKRGDMIRWLEDGRSRRHGPMLLSLGAQISQDEQLATRSVDIARTYLSLARQTLPDGRSHGCSARSVSAVARGHGRDNDTGVITGVLGPILTWKSM